jgi:hypothetical protein
MRPLLFVIKIVEQILACLFIFTMAYARRHTSAVCFISRVMLRLYMCSVKRRHPSAAAAVAAAAAAGAVTRAFRHLNETSVEYYIICLRQQVVSGRQRNGVISYDGCVGKR